MCDVQVTPLRRMESSPVVMTRSLLKLIRPRLLRPQPCRVLGDQIIDAAGALHRADLPLEFNVVLNQSRHPVALSDACMTWLAWMPEKSVQRLHAGDRGRFCFDQSSPGRPDSIESTLKRRPVRIVRQMLHPSVGRKKGLVGLLVIVDRREDRIDRWRGRGQADADGCRAGDDGYGGAACDVFSQCDAPQGPNCPENTIPYIVHL